MSKSSKRGIMGVTEEVPAECPIRAHMRLRFVHGQLPSLGRILLSAIVMLTAIVAGLAQTYPLSRDAVVDFFCDASGDCWALILRNIANDRNMSSYWVRTVNNGNAWTSWQPSMSVNELFFLNSDFGWGLTGGTNPSLARTHDGGVTWEKLSPLPRPVDGGKPRIERIRFLDSENGWIIGAESGGLSYVVHTSDGGKNLKTVPELCGLNLPAGGIVVIPPLGNESVMYSEDEGLSWRQQLGSSDRQGRLFALALADIGDDGQGLAFGLAGHAEILKTEDFGKHWTLAFHAIGAKFLTSASFWDSNDGCAVGASTSLYCTSDGGLNWTTKNSLPGRIGESRVQDIVYARIIFGPGGRRGWALREVGFLYQTDDGGESWHPLDLLRASKESQ